MTTINAINILIDRNPMTKIPKTAWAWEVPLYRSQYGDEAVQIIGEPVPRPVAEVPDAHDEFARLRGIFGVDADTKQSHTELVYGRGLDGVEKLGKAIKASVKGGAEAVQKVADAGHKISDEQKEARADSHVDPLADEVSAGAEAKPGSGKPGK